MPDNTGPLPPYTDVVNWSGAVPYEYLNYQSPNGIAVAEPPPGAFEMPFPKQAQTPRSHRERGTDGAWQWTCTAWDREGISPIIMVINPENVTWTIPFRVSRVNTFGGTIFHRWQNLNRSPVDLPTLKVRMNTGNIFPAASFSSATVDGQRVTMAPLSTDEKRGVFFWFCSLTHQPAFVGGEPNIVSVTYKSVLFGDVNLFVVFTEPLTFTEDAAKPFNVQYEIGMTVVGQNPEFSSPDQFASSMMGG